MQHRAQQDERQQIVMAVAKLRPGPQRRYPGALRAKIGQYAVGQRRAGVTAERVSKELGVSLPTLERIMAETKAQPMFQQVRLVESTQERGRTESVVVRGPGGIVIEGLNIAQLAILIRGLS
jgi:hypothetical protein